jgi:hypothetical protein
MHQILQRNMLGQTIVDVPRNVSDLRQVFH